jgi:hypothetical protein
MSQQSSNEFYASVGDSALWIELADGSRFYYKDTAFTIPNMAASLSKMCRYNGHCTRLYTVAQHSILVADIMENKKLGDPREGFMHDGQESILSDIPSPWKVLLPDYKNVEAVLEIRLRKQYGLPEKSTDGCKKADYLALHVEVQELIISKGENWEAPPGLKEEACAYIEEFSYPESFWFKDPSDIEVAYLEKYAELFGKI